MPEALETQVYEDEELAGVTIVKLIGSLDGNTYQGLDGQVSALLQEGHCKLIFDLSDLNYVASAGIGIFINSQQIANDGGGFIMLAAPSNSVAQVFTILGLQALFTIHESLDSARTEARNKIN